MRKITTLAACAILLAASSGCGKAQEKSAPESTEPPLPSVIATEAHAEEASKAIGDSITWYNDAGDLATMTLTSAEYITECSTTWATEPAEGNYLLKIEYTLEALDTAAFRETFPEGIDAPYSDFKWVDAEGFVQPNAWGSNASQYCDEPTGRPATHLSAGDATRGAIVLEVKSQGGQLLYGLDSLGWEIP